MTPWQHRDRRTDTERVRATWYRLRIELRARWRAWPALALIVGLTGGAVLALAAGARRTDSSYRRFLRAQDAYDVQVSANVVDASGAQGKPTDIVNFGRVEGTPYVLGAVLAAASIAPLAYILVSAVRRRRRDLAVLKTLGFVRGQVRATVACQATVVVAVSLLVGVPLGIAVGRWLWSRLAMTWGS